MSADPRRFSRLDGVALLGVPGSDPVVVGAQSGIEAAAPASGGHRWGWWAAGAVLAAALLGAAMMLRAARHRAGGRSDS